jgi:isopenicillin-N epimerase
VRPEMQAQVTPLVISHGWSEDRAAPGPFGGSAFIDALEVQGTRDPAAWLAVPAALAFLRQHGWQAVARRCGEMAQETAGRVAELTGLQPLSSAAFSAPQMVAMPVPACDTQALQRRLWEAYRIEIPCYQWRGHSIVRLSVQGYNSQKDLDALVAALRVLLPEYVEARAQHEVEAPR